MKILTLAFLFLLAIFPLGQLARFDVGESGIIFLLNDLVVGFLVGGWIIWHFAKKRAFALPPLGKTILTFWIIALVSLLVNFSKWDHNLVASFYLLRWVFYAGLYFFLYEFFLEKSISEKRVFRIMILVGVVVGLLGIFQYFLYPDLRNLYYLGWDPHYFRVFSTFLDPAFTGMILVLTLIMIISYVVKKNFKEERLRWWIILSLVSTYIGLSLTYSRSAYGAFLSGVFAISYLKKSFKLLLIVLLTFIITLVILPKREDRIGSNFARQESSLARIISWQHSFQIIKDHPILGVGFNNYRQAQKEYGFLEETEWSSHAGAGGDSSLLFIWATTGVFGFIVYLWLGWKIVTLGLRSWFINNSLYGLVLFSSLVALLFHSLFVNSLFYPWVMEWIWILAAIVSAEMKKSG